MRTELGRSVSICAGKPLRASSSATIGSLTATCTLLSRVPRGEGAARGPLSPCSPAALRPAGDGRAWASLRVVRVPEEGLRIVRRQGDAVDGRRLPGHGRVDEEVHHRHFVLDDLLRLLVEVGALGRVDLY